MYLPIYTYADVLFGYLPIKYMILYPLGRVSIDQRLPVDEAAGLGTLHPVGVVDDVPYARRGTDAGDLIYLEGGG